MIQGISHLTFTVKDLDRAAMFFTRVFGAREIYSSGDDTFSLSREKFLLIGDIWIAIMEADALRARSYDHVAFAVSEEELDEYLARIKELGLEIRPPRPRMEGEGRSLYFYDFDNHLFELHTGTLQQRLARYAKGRGAP